MHEARSRIEVLFGFMGLSQPPLRLKGIDIASKNIGVTMNRQSVHSDDSARIQVLASGESQARWCNLSLKFDAGDWPDAKDFLDNCVKIRKSLGFFVWDRKSEICLVKFCL